MNINTTRNDVLSASSERGLIAYLFEIAQDNPQALDTNILETVAELIRSGESTLFGEQDWEFLNRMKINPVFFRGMGLLCELVPLLHVGHRDMMQLVSTLVSRGGEDLAATQPYVAFRKWCTVDLVRVRAVLDDARNGDDLAIEHLCFALEAGADSVSALEFLNDNSESKAKREAAIALGRMTLDAEIATTAIHSLSEVSIKSQDIQVRNCALLSSFEILDKHPGIPCTDVRRALDKTLDDTSAENLHALSNLIWMHGKSLSEEEVRLVLNALQSVESEHHGTLQSIDYAVPDLVREGYFDALSDLVAELIRNSQGKIGVDTFSNFRKELVDGDRQRFSRLVVKWFLEGNFYLCSSLAKLFNIVGSKQLTLELQPSDLPADPKEQLFICRKAVGFIFLAPISVASLFVVILQHGDSGIAEDVLTLLYNPLLVSFSGELQKYLKDVVKQNSNSNVVRISEVLNQKQQALDALVGIETLIELHPSEQHRHIENIRFNREMTQTMKEGRKQSVFFDFVTIQTLLYGSSATSYIVGPGGELRSVNIEMKSHSIEYEYPQLDIFDPEGLNMMLLEFMCEQRTNP